MSKEWTQEERAEVAKRLANGRDKAKKRREAAQLAKGEGELLDSDHASFTFTEVARALHGVSMDWIVANVPDDQVKDFAGLLSGALELAAKRDQILVGRRNQMLCDACEHPLPNGRFAGEIVYLHPQTNELTALRACSEGCYGKIQAIANSIKRQSGAHRPVTAM